MKGAKKKISYQAMINSRPLADFQSQVCPNCKARIKMKGEHLTGYAHDEPIYSCEGEEE